MSTSRALHWHRRGESFLSLCLSSSQYTRLGHHVDNTGRKPFIIDLRQLFCLLWVTRISHSLHS